MKISSEVREALASRRPVVALETAVLTHGLPRPLNLEVARECEAAVRQAGAVPATVAVLDGEIRVGLAPEELERLAADSRAGKCAARDLGALVAAGRSAGTTVSATLAVSAVAVAAKGASLDVAGIAVMSTGGIGGVHRGDGSDVSADLAQLARSPVLVVSAGAKAILDLPRTLERLETLGVPVLGYGADEFPGFYTRETGLRLEHRFDTPEAIARAVVIYRQLGYQGGILVAQPPPESMGPQELESALERVLARAKEKGISGPATTPFLLAALAEETGGRTLELNRKLLVANARLAGEIACALR